MWLKREEEEQRGIAVVQEPRGEGEKDVAAVSEVETPVAFALRDLHVTIDIGIPPPGLHGIDPHSTLQDVVGAPSDAFTDDRVVMVPSPTLSISTVSDWTSTIRKPSNHFLLFALFPGLISFDSCHFSHFLRTFLSRWYPGLISNHLSHFSSLISLIST